MRLPRILGPRILGPRILGTSSFRLTLFYAGIFCGSFAVLFGVIYWSTAEHMSRLIDSTVAGEIAELQAAGAGSDPARTTAVVAEYTARAPDFYYLLQDAGGKKLAGNIPPMDPPVAGVNEDLRQKNGEDDDEAKTVRGQGLRLGDGTYLFVGKSTQELHEMQAVVRQTFQWGFAATIVIALAGGALMSQGVLGRIESLNRISRDIMAGDLSQRIEVRGSNDEFDRLAAGLNSMLNRIQSLMDGLQQISTDIAHELRTPLTRLRQRVELATRRASDAEALNAALRGTLRDIDSVLETFGALLRIVQLESSSHRATFTSVDLTEALETIFEVYLPMAEEKRQTLVRTVPPGLAVEGDRELLMQLFANLVENAVRHTPAETRIEIAAAAGPDGIDVTVADGGEGIPPAMRAHVFARFFRLEASRTTPGNGLGLSLAAAIAALHHARIELSDNEPGLRAQVRLKRIALIEEQKA